MTQELGKTHIRKIFCTAPQCENTLLLFPNERLGDYGWVSVPTVTGYHAVACRDHADILRGPL